MADRAASVSAGVPKRGVRLLGMLVHHTDAEREFSYDRKSIVGTLGKGIDDAEASGWHLIDMKKDWKRVFSK